MTQDSPDSASRIRKVCRRDTLIARCGGSSSKRRSPMERTPGQVIEECMDYLNISRGKLAERMQMHFLEVEALIAGKRLITVDLAIRLQNALGPPAQFWLQHDRLHRGGPKRS